MQMFSKKCFYLFRLFFRDNPGIFAGDPVEESVFRSYIICMRCNDEIF